MDFAEARASSNRVRELYERLERQHHGSEWTTSELLVGMLQDVGDLGRLVMASEGRWTHGADVSAELGHELGEVLWWLFVLAERTGTDLEAAFEGFLEERTRRLSDQPSR